MRRWLYLMEFPQSNGQSLLNMVAKERRTPLTSQHVEARAITENLKLDNVYKNAYDTLMSPAKRMLREVNTREPGLIEFLLKNRILDNAAVVNSLVTQARVYDGRRGR